MIHWSIRWLLLLLLLLQLLLLLLLLLLFVVVVVVVVVAVVVDVDVRCCCCCCCCCYFCCYCSCICYAFMITLRNESFSVNEKWAFIIKKWLSLGCRHPVEGRIFKTLEFGGLNMLTLRIGPFWVDEGFWKNFEIFSPGHARPCPCLYTAYIQPFICLAEKTK